MSGGGSEWSNHLRPKIGVLILPYFIHGTTTLNRIYTKIHFPSLLQVFLYLPFNIIRNKFLADEAWLMQPRQLHKLELIRSMKGSQREDPSFETLEENKQSQDSWCFDHCNISLFVNWKSSLTLADCPLVIFLEIKPMPRNRCWYHYRQRSVIWYYGCFLVILIFTYARHPALMGLLPL